MGGMIACAHPTKIPPPFRQKDGGIFIMLYRLFLRDQAEMPGLCQPPSTMACTASTRSMAAERLTRQTLSPSTSARQRLPS